MAYAILNDYIDKSLYPLKAPHTMTPESITIHNTANDATALNEIAYMKRNTAPTSYHAAIDDKHVVQAIPFSRNAFHAGDGQGKGNRASIGIEICYSKSGGQRYIDAEENAIEYIAHVLKQYGWGIDRVKWHRDWSGKNCPHRIFFEGRADEVKKRISAKLAVLYSVASTQESDKKEDKRMFIPSSGTLKSAYEQFLNDAIKNGDLSKQWLADFKANKLSLDDALALKVIVYQRRK